MRASGCRPRPRDAVGTTGRVRVGGARRAGRDDHDGTEQRRVEGACPSTSNAQQRDLAMSAHEH